MGHRHSDQWHKENSSLITSISDSSVTSSVTSVGGEGGGGGGGELTGKSEMVRNDTGWNCPEEGMGLCYECP